MTWRTASDAVWIALAVGLAALAALARWGGGRIARPGDLVGAAVSRALARAALLAGWAWLGVHFFAR